MCGISGFQGDFDPELLTKMNTIMAHRGPDDYDTFFDPVRRTGLAHRRLAIIELSSLGRQPMWDSTTSLAVIFNGEIYNYRELRHTLIDQGYKFNSSSDTEVLLNLYLRDGAAMLPRLNGIFAFAIFDTRDDTLLLARDGVGVKPLYYAEIDPGFLFASELKAILLENRVPREPSAKAIHCYMTYLWSPAPLTMLKAVRKLEPGWALRVVHGRVASRWQFYRLPYSNNSAHAPVTETIRVVRSALDAAVHRQMVSDAPLGAFLSGGLDSSSVVASACKFTGSKKLQCFTIAERLLPNEGFSSDLPFARQVARCLNVDLHEVEISDLILNDLACMIYHLDEPQADLSGVLVLYISKLAAQNGIKVLLSGAGADDIFAGYRRHQAVQLEKYWSWLPGEARRFVKFATGLLPVSNPLFRRIRKAFQYAQLDGNDRLASYFHWTDPQAEDQIYSQDMQAEIAKQSFSEDLLASLAQLPSTSAPLNKVLYLDAKHFLSDHNFNYTDKLSMAAGVEVRVPYLDSDLLGVVARLPMHYKQHGMTGKWILRKAMEGILPDQVIHRGKTGFAAALREWFRNGIPGGIKEMLSHSSLDRRGIFNPKGIARIVEWNKRGRIDASYTLLAIICIEIWFRTFLDHPVPEIYQLDSLPGRGSSQASVPTSVWSGHLSVAK